LKERGIAITGCIRQSKNLSLKMNDKEKKEMAKRDSKQYKNGSIAFVW